MKIDTLSYDGAWRTLERAIACGEDASLVLVFGDSDSLVPGIPLAEIRRLYPNAFVVGASSAGNIQGVEVSQAPYIATAVQFEKGHIEVASVDYQLEDSVEELSRALIAKLPAQGLKHAFVLSDGLKINGSDLVRGLNSSSQHLPITGGMAGDGDRFEKTWVICGDSVKDQRVVAIGFYGEDFVISHGCFAGWSDFGAYRTITRSQGNVLFELDGVPALDLYKKYLGDYAPDLPNSGMRFPLSIREHEDAPEVIRTLLAIDEDQRSITFAGDVPVGYTARLMQPDIDILIDGAEKAAQEIDNIGDAPALGLVVSCTGRKIVLSELVEEELEIIGETLGSHVQLTGFYSYGEIAPFSDAPLSCQLHNQTMTLTGIYEK